MIRRIQVRNFKSLHGEEGDPFTLDLDKFTCLIGLNGSGKSTILQFFDFLVHVMRGTVSEWLASRDWRAGELNFQHFSPKTFERVKRKNINFTVEMELDGALTIWEAEFNRDKRYCVNEKITVSNETILHVEAGKYRYEGKPYDIIFEYEGSILSVLKEKAISDSTNIIKQEILNIKSLELLSPHLLHKRSRGKRPDVGRWGEHITAYLSGITSDAWGKIDDHLSRMFPSYDGFIISSKKAGWKELTFIEKCPDGSVYFDSRHASDGLLRLLAITAEVGAPHAFMLLDEIENGLSPEVVEKVVDLLVTAQPQVLVTTHSPLILNYLDDATAVQAMQFIYKTDDGRTRATPFFDLPGMREKLEAMGPGEVFADTSLERLSKLARKKTRHSEPPRRRKRST